MIEEVQALLDEYVAWLRDKTVLRELGGEWIEITTPYIDRHNDCLQIYARRDNGAYLLTDDGATIEDLEQSGVSLDSKRRQELLQTTLNGFGIRRDAKALVVRATRDTFALRKHNLVQAMLAVNDLFYVAAPIVTSLFLEDVTTWLRSNDIRFTPNVKFTGKSGYDHVFDFVVPASRQRPERILKAINRPTKETAQTLAFAWIDTRDVRPESSTAYAILNDSEHGVPPTVIDALRSYDVTPVVWSERSSAIEELAA